MENEYRSLLGDVSMNPMLLMLSVWWIYSVVGQLMQLGWTFDSGRVGDRGSGLPKVRKAEHIN